MQASIRSKLSQQLNEVAFALAAATIAASTSASANTLLSESFEDGLLDPRLSVQTVGNFTSPPGIRDTADFGSTKAFGYGRTSCQFDCFLGNVTYLTITFDSPTFISSISFKEKEKFDNWGSQGFIFLNDDPSALPKSGFGKYINDRTADNIFRQFSFDLNTTVTTVRLRVEDITNLSEIYLDDLVVTSAVPEPAAVVSMLTGLALLCLRANQSRRHEKRPRTASTANPKFPRPPSEFVLSC